MDRLNIFLIAGEDSGDLHGANLVKALKGEMTQGIPGSHKASITLKGVGGDKLKAEGMELVAHIKDINFMGFWEVIRNLRTIRRLFKTVRAEIDQFQPDFVILIDYPGFNLRLTKELYEKNIPVYYYISPQVWAWKKGRVKTIKRFVHKMYVILPFEQDFYAKEGVEVAFVGHPLLDALGEREKPLKREKLIALLPGSRKQEIQRMLPEMLKLVPRFPEYQFVVAGAPSQDRAFYEVLMGDSPAELCMNQTYSILDRAAFAVVTSGTATLETALFGVPQVVVYKGNALSYQIGKRLVNVKYISLVNLILDKLAVAELIQQDFHTDKVEAELRKLMEPTRHKVVLHDYNTLRATLGGGGASIRTAQGILSRFFPRNNPVTAES